MSVVELSGSVLGERLRTARSNVGITQDFAANELQVARTTLVAIEAGSRRPKTSELIKLASLYGTSVNALLQRDRVELDLVLQFRRSETTRWSDDDVTKTTRMLQSMAEGYLSLEEMLGEPLATDYPAPRPIRRARPREQAEDAAMELRGRFGLGTGPLTDVLGFMEDELKIRVFERPLPSAVAGAFAYDARVGALMVVNSLHPRFRRDWSAAHECGHFLAHRDEMDVVYESDATRARDRFADHFAAALLMPGTGLRKRFEDTVSEHSKFSPRSLVALARSYRVSVEAMCRRLESLGLVPSGTFDSLKAKGLSQRLIDDVMGPAVAVDGPIPCSRRMSLLATEAYAKRHLSEAQVEKILQLDRVVVRRLLDALSLEEETGT